MKKMIIAISALSVIALAGCGGKATPTTEPTIESTIESTVESTEPSTEATTETTTENTAEPVAEPTTESVTEPQTESQTEVPTEAPTEETRQGDTVQDGREEITNGNDETIYGKVGEYIDMTQATGGGYTVGNITIIKGDSISIMGRDSVMGEKAGATKVECTMYDEDTGTKTESTFNVVIK